MGGPDPPPGRSRRYKTLPLEIGSNDPRQAGSSENERVPDVRNCSQRQGLAARHESPES